MHQTLSSGLRLAGTLLAAVFASASPPASAQAYPSKPITVVIQYPVGGPSDALARIVAPRMQAALGQPLVIDARVGAGGNIGTDAVAKARPDGYTLLLSSSGPLAISPWLYPKLPYNPLKDLAPVVQLAAVPLVLEVNEASPARSAAAFLSMLKANPGKYSFGSSGNGTPQHLSAALLGSLAGVTATHVPYKGQAPMANDLMGGQIDFAIDSMVSAMPNLATGRLRALAVTSRKRSPLLPEVPTLEEAGVPGYEALAWYGLLAPAGTPRAIVDKLNEAARKALDTPAVREQIARLGSAPVHATPEQFGAFIKAEHDKWGPIVKSTGAIVD
ncbi:MULTISPECIES: tripartite tricarboxylate transporter substrate binding protein [unclassified Variovorax]|jgi:tripartite-type tricarboxylate transporter receptor subunit TctC|uniref:Bug family tripartite tricarboxylate transporter substrate binding protein n=1 Tax=unclassified Variovorax TaxID=663243 RepID=UPI000F7ED65B|nr:MULTISPECIES: tripartite tricarboxylate transporter substrate binding protein [unclassified Variovorax]RSZ33232.1 tripartite tricarboxylate transporter substrate binding protein [Variovorax sp. 553]RSZ33604.1 tripartite tricarboxylate transporter substrate binding protein [Variovorax sp. 679]